MRTKPFQCILSFLALVGTAHGTITPTAECTAQAWARAPDLAPNTIMHGDARVKISADCPTVESVLLGLRFKERSFAKALRSREDAKQLNTRHNFANPSFSGSPVPIPPRFANKSDKEAYEKLITNEALWIVREEERVVFETMQPINMWSRNHGALRDTIHDFSIFVPSTNFPPAIEDMRNGFSLDMKHEIVYAEWIYEYFAQISFSNGTTEEISAGFTAFQPQYDPAHASQGLTSATTELKPLLFGDMGENTVNYSIEISADSGLTFVAGTKSHIVTAVVTRTGFARTFSAPLNVFPCVKADLSPTWIAEYGMLDYNPRPVPLPRSVLHATSNGKKPSFRAPECSHPRNPGVSVMMPNSTLDEIQANEIVTTTSAPFTISTDLDDTHIPTFETYYQTLSNSLTITLETPRGGDTDVDPDVPSGNRDFGWGSWGPQFEDDEDEWVPWVKQKKVKGPQMPAPKTWRSYSGRVAVVVHPSKERTPSSRCLHTSTDTLGQAVLSDEMGCEQRPLIHYLDEGARGPAFVDRYAVLDPAARELRTSILDPVVSSPPEGEERTCCYYIRSNPQKPPIYVGETWARKVINKN